MHSTSPLITICVPLFNDEKYIGACIDSILRQENINFEILICDNNSTDGSSSIYSSYVDSRIRVIKNEKNIGSIKNFNKCINNVRGKYFMLLPSDDILVDGGLKKLVSELEINPKLVLAFGLCQNINSNNELLLIPQQLTINSGVNDFSQMCVQIIENFNPLQHPLVRVSALNNKMRFSLHLGTFTDIYLWSKLFFLGWSAFYINEPTTCIRTHSRQAQNHYRLITDENILRLNSHYDFKFSDSFYIKNSYNFLFLLFARNYIKRTYFLNEIERRNIKKIILNHLILSILISIKISLLNKKLKMIKREMSILYKCTNLFGLFNVGNHLLLILIKFILKKFILMFK